jgi:hypothetical protein
MVAGTTGRVRERMTRFQHLVPVTVRNAFVVDLLGDTGRFDRGEAELLLTRFEGVEVEARRFPTLLEGLFRL